MASTELLSQQEFTFTPSDVRLKTAYKGSPAWAPVSSHVMSLASPVWKKFIFPPWRTDPESENVPVDELDFTEDNSDVLLILLCAAHLEFSQIDKAGYPPRAMLVQLAITCDKYLCASLLNPWIEGWMNREFRGEGWVYPHWKNSHIINPHSAEDAQDYILLERVSLESFARAKNIFGSGVWYLYRDCDEAEVQSKIRLQYPIPSSIFEKIDTAREKTTDAILSEIYTYLARIDKKTYLCHWHKTNCEQIMLSDLKKRNLYPKSALNMPMSPNKILETIFGDYINNWSHSGHVYRRQVGYLKKKTKDLIKKPSFDLWESICPAKAHVGIPRSRLESVAAEWTRQDELVRQAGWIRQE